jgi:hypothetical protein
MVNGNKALNSVAVGLSERLALNSLFPTLITIVSFIEVEFSTIESLSIVVGSEAV